MGLSAIRAVNRSTRKMLVNAGARYEDARGV